MEHSKWTKGSLEAEISKTLTQWEKDFLGRGSVSVKTDILRDMLVISLSGVLTPAEYQLCSAKEGLLAVKRMRSDLVESGREFLGNLIQELTGEEVKSFHTDISTHTGERIMVFRLSGNLQEKLQ
ncbi:YbcI [Planococcus donghaensis MPA1U2]|uniref:YbcI n=1 Tax=Planococcus donghaensis MPA1U2 TaxID=933115 RepID=E7RKL4_9BACL|nr:DUF2294 domain-containing protein [Planococcus donghaensis]EGA88444.1 YbcI [Planococcus donghaensis MPA1U2]